MLRGGDGPCVHGVGVAERAVAVGHIRRRARWPVRYPLQNVVDHRPVRKRFPGAGDVVPTHASTGVESRPVADLEPVTAQLLDEGCFKIHQGITGVCSVTDVALLPVGDSTEIGVRHVPQGAGQVLFPILNPVLIFVSGILTARRVCFPCIKDTVEVRVFLAVIKRITVRVVVPWVAGLSRIPVGAVDLDAVADAVAVGIRRGRIG